MARDKSRFYDYNKADSRSASYEHSSRKCLSANAGAHNMRLYMDQNKVFVKRTTSQRGTVSGDRKVYVEVEATFTKDGFLRPVWIIWEDGTRYMIDKVQNCKRAASLSAGGCGILYECMVCGRQIHLFYEENYKWFVCRN